MEPSDFEPGSSQVSPDRSLFEHDEGRADEALMFGTLVAFYAFRALKCDHSEPARCHRKSRSRCGAYAAGFHKKKEAALNVNRTKHRVGAIVFEKTAKWGIRLEDGANEEQLLNKLDALNFTSGGTSISAALKELKENIARIRHNRAAKKETAAKFTAFLITDGKANIGGGAEKDADQLKTHFGVDMYCIGITGVLHIDALKKIASKQENVFTMRSYDSLQWLADELTNATVAASTVKPHQAVNTGLRRPYLVNYEVWPLIASASSMPLVQPTLLRDDAPSLPQDNLSEAPPVRHATSAHCLKKHRPQALTFCGHGGPSTSMWIYRPFLFFMPITGYVVSATATIQRPDSTSMTQRLKGAFLAGLKL
ncbi:hypothetical protein MTO96_049217 [Rhipicephalus appendiculatus]